MQVSWINYIAKFIYKLYNYGRQHLAYHVLMFNILHTTFFIFGFDICFGFQYLFEKLLCCLFGISYIIHTVSQIFALPTTIYWDGVRILRYLCSSCFQCLLFMLSSYLELGAYSNVYWLLTQLIVNPQLISVYFWVIPTRVRNKLLFFDLLSRLSIVL